MRQRVFSARAIHFGPFASLFTFILGGQFLLPQLANPEKRSLSNKNEMDELSDSRVYLLRIHQSTKTILILMYVGVGG